MKVVAATAVIAIAGGLIAATATTILVLLA